MLNSKTPPEADAEHLLVPAVVGAVTCMRRSMCGVIFRFRGHMRAWSDPYLCVGCGPSLTHRYAWNSHSFYVDRLCSYLTLYFLLFSYVARENTYISIYIGIRINPDIACQKIHITFHLPIDDQVTTQHDD